tara:strand:- start:1696 stop:2211 length:516 start_codon:yes stop_codon:yes gene_type:complete
MYSKNIINYLLSFFLIFNIFFYSKKSISENIETPIEIANPIFTTKGINEMPYTIKAASGIQIGNNLELFQIEGKIKNRDNIWIYLNADKGNYDQISQVVFLFNNIEVYTNNKEKLISDEAIIDMKKDIITLLYNVEYENSYNKIKADKSVIRNNFQSFEYIGSVKTNLKNN